MKILVLKNRCIARALLIVTIIFTMMIGGCEFEQEEQIESSYGRRHGFYHGASVNGTSVLGDIFESAGHKVYSWSSLSPRLNQADCIVWFPDDFEVPDQKTIDWFEEWLTGQSGRTLIYVGRDYDAEPDYWDAVKSRIPQEKMSQWSEAKSNADLRVIFERNWNSIVSGNSGDEEDVVEVDDSATSDEDDEGDSEDEVTSVSCDWFTLHKGMRRTARGSLFGSLLEGDDPSGASSLDDKKLDIRLGHTIEPSYDFFPLLSTEKGETIIAERFNDNSYYGWSHRTILVVNGSFLLNYPLINHENRKLARRLVDQIGRSEQTVVFLETEGSSPEICSTDRENRGPSDIKLLTYFPINWLFIHLALIGILYCFYRWPIFGRPRRLPQAPREDFLAHIEAVGDHLRRGGRSDIARQKLAEYHRRLGESGQSTVDRGS